MGRRYGGHAKVLRVVTDLIDASAESSADSSAKKSEVHSHGDDNDNHNTKRVLTFQSSFQRQSNPLVGLAPNMKLDEFLLHTDHLLNAGKSVHSKIVPNTSELQEEWAVACDRVGACLPNLDYGVIMSVRTAGISIPGLSVEWSALIGTNLVYQSQYYQNQQQYPELEFVLIKDESKVSSGAKPIVWIYNKLIRDRKNARNRRSKDRSTNTDTKMFTRLGFYKERSLTATSGGQDIDNGENESLVIRCVGTMEMNFRIPSFLWKLLFSSNGESQKAKAERKMSNLITRYIEKDAEQNLLRWEKNFRAWTHSS
jgi:hypothetical protein